CTASRWTVACWVPTQASKAREPGPRRESAGCTLPAFPCPPEPRSGIRASAGELQHRRRSAIAAGLQLQPPPEVFAQARDQFQANAGFTRVPHPAVVARQATVDGADLLGTRPVARVPDDDGGVLVQLDIDAAAVAVF